MAHTIIALAAFAIAAVWSIPGPRFTVGRCFRCGRFTRHNSPRCVRHG